MKISYNWLQSFFETKLPPAEKLADVLTSRFAEVEDVNRVADDFILDMDIRPNRAGDCFSHAGVAREVAVILKKKLKSQNAKILEGRKLKAKDFISVRVADKKACPRYTARAIFGVSIGPSPKWMQERLTACGLRPINNIVDVTNYVMLELGQPLHAFDGSKIAGKKIIVRFAKEGESLIALDSEKYDLNRHVLVIADQEKALAIAGIKGGKAPEIDARTQIVILESANFNPQIVRRASKGIDLKTDASLRFEHGVDPNLTEPAINRAAVLIMEAAGGAIASGLIDCYPKKALGRRISLDLKYVSSFLGSEIKEKEAREILSGLGFKLKAKKGGLLEVEIPTRRMDVSLSEDLIEEIGRIHGYEKIRADLPLSAVVLPRRNESVFWEETAEDLLKEVGMTEIYNYSFVGEKEAALFGFDSNLIELENPLSLEYQYLRPSLVPNLLKNIQRNQESFNVIKVFEIGKIFEKPANEEKMLSCVMIGKGFGFAKGVTNLLLNKFGINGISYNECKNDARGGRWWNQNSAEIRAGKERIGFLGEIHSDVLSSYKIKSRVVYIDLFFEKICGMARSDKKYKPLLKYPAAARDIAILVPRQTKIESIFNEIQSVSGSLLVNIDLFDIYEGNAIPEGKKNVAFHLTFQAEDRTLSSKEIDEIQDKIFKALEANPEWNVRR